jgi:hypothetical protein
LYFPSYSDLYKQSVDQVPKVIDYLKDKGYKFFTAAACNNDANPHTNNSSVNAASAMTNTTSTPLNEANNDASASSAVANNKSASGSSIGMSSNTSYIMSLAILVLSVTILF